MSPRFHKLILHKIRDHGASVRFAPFSEMLLYEWKKANGFTAYGSMERLIAKISAAI